MNETGALLARQTFAHNLNRLLAKKGCSQADLAARFSITASTVSDWCTGKKYPRVDNMQLLAEFFDVSRAELTESASVGSAYAPTRRIPILGRVAAGAPLYAEEHIEGYTHTDLNGEQEYFALRVQGNSMNALRINDGDLLIVRRQDIVENGEIAVVLTEEDAATVKRFYQNGSMVTLLPQSTDSSFEPQTYDLSKTRLRVLGKVVENKISFEG